MMTIPAATSLRLRQVGFAKLTLAVLCLCLVPAEPSDAADRPNVLLIMGDDI